MNIFWEKLNIIIKNTIKNSRIVNDKLILIIKKGFNKKTDSKIIKKESSIINDIIIAFLLAMFVRSFLFEPFHIPSGSMKPGLIEGDFIFVSKYSYGYSKYSFPFSLPILKERIFFKNKPQRGDVIVFRLPSNSKINYIKRLIGLPGDKIQMRNGVLYINKKQIPKEYLGTTLEYKNIENSTVEQYLESLDNGISFITLDKTKFGSADNTPEFSIPNGYYFFMGDNRDNSIDSRFAETGFVPEINIVGEAKIIFFSIDSYKLKTFKISEIIRFNRLFKKIK